jgi:hypothetical protein
MKSLLSLSLIGLLTAGCGGEQPEASAIKVRKIAAPVKKSAGFGPGEVKTFEAKSAATLLMSQSQFVMDSNGKGAPGPAKLVLWQKVGDAWQHHIVEDPASNVFHKAMAYGDGQILTIAGDKAMVRTWSLADGSWSPTTIEEGSWGGKFNRYRDVEFADFDGDGVDEIALATHDMGVVTVGDMKDGAWTFTEHDKAADTFVHEIEVGDVDGDGTVEFYATPSDRNRSSGVSQPGMVVRYDQTADGGYKRSTVVKWASSHAKEILVADLDGKGDALFAVIEAHTEKDAVTGKVEIVDPVKIVRLDPKADGSWSETVIAELQDRQCRFIVPGDIDGDGQIEIVAAAMDSGLWALQPDGDGTFTPELIDAKSGGFEHATHLADLDNDGQMEIYVASDKQKEFRRYVYVDGQYRKEVIAPIPAMHITWNLQDGVF